MTDKEYLENQFKRLVNGIYGFSIKISDGEGNSTNRMELTPNRAKHILEWLNKNWSVTVERDGQKIRPIRYFTRKRGK
jgi:hypothetical protein